MVLYRFLRALLRIFFRLFYRWQISGTENIPQTGGVIVCGNHISNYDPPLLGSAMEREITFMAKDSLFKIPLLSAILPSLGAFPVKRGAGDRGAIRASLEILSAGKALCLFPEGTRSKTGEVGKGQGGAAMLAIRSNAEVIPAAIIGPYRLFRPVKIVYGKPVDLSAFRGQKTNSEMIENATEAIMEAIRQLQAEHR
ncbi:1-acyl-sn-glycerol-3-phosphate acyltransferase [Tumebacillus algifaecis]|uniref:1-acyl-sn-glycerol-3-phosphate acyltransferase n=1 Tax=Tumebacillus algifaecis TaxID=1214604 RepID=A0A223D1B0_9BACL|nr:lysophospholipid acyltransferase family protein [Tumebacillus algifaecis]ASS75167.1 1-acyl-sn-glycerol-3-phosphate acyltransferase [Tumebacillus algifaecis]